MPLGRGVIEGPKGQGLREACYRVHALTSDCGWCASFAQPFFFFFFLEGNLKRQIAVRNWLTLFVQPGAAESGPSRDKMHLRTPIKSGSVGLLTRPLQAGAVKYPLKPRSFYASLPVVDPHLPGCGTTCSRRASRQGVGVAGELSPWHGRV